MNPFAPITRAPEAVERLNPQPYLGIDAEWDIRTGEPTIWGVSDGRLTVSGTHELMWGRITSLLARPGIQLVGHNMLQADLLVMKKLGVDFPAERVDDTIIWHWLNNLHLCKAGSKFSDGDGDKRGRGFMGIFPACNLATGVPNWKACVGEEQCEAEHRPCPEHDVFGYNGNDAYWPVIALPQMKMTAKLRGVDWLYPVHRDLSVVMGKMTEKGIYVDRDYVAKLEATLDEQKKTYYDPGTKTGSLGFNPRSPKQVRESLASDGIFLQDTTEDAIRDALEDHPDSTRLIELLDYKELGGGSDRWFAPRVWKPKAHEWEGYVDETGYIHPNFSLFTSSGRLASSNPNFQNISVRRGTAIRKAVVPPPGMSLWEADLSNAENRALLWMAGYHDLPKIDLHSWILSLLKLSEDHPFSVKMGGARQAAKSVQHASNYGEGLSLLTEDQLKSPKVLREERHGARVIFRDWLYTDRQIYTVSFTGIHLAERAFGNHSLESRRLALSVQESYFAAFPLVRQLQRNITKQVEKEGRVRPPSGLVTLSYGQPADRIKTALALWGSQPVAMWTKLAMLKADREFPEADLRAQIHDALLFYFPKKMLDSDVAAMLKSIMQVTVPGIEGLVLTSDLKTGPSWGEMEKYREE